jgi:sigma54-dependent transcription regulator
MRGELTRRYALPNIIGESDSMQEVFRIVTKVAPSQATVLLRGESGTGKELIAHALHYQGLHPKGPFIAINCAALPENLLEAELFGYDKGAFTGAVTSKPGRFELARGGTIFLDEVGDVTPTLQAKLLRVLQERTFERLGGTRTLTTDARIVSATNRDLEAMSKAGEFREDLYWRLNVVPIFLPALRERREDLPVLVEFFLRRFSAAAGTEAYLSAEAMRRLLGYPWRTRCSVWWCSQTMTRSERATSPCTSSHTTYPVTAHQADSRSTRRSSCSSAGGSSSPCARTPMFRPRQHAPWESLRASWATRCASTTSRTDSAGEAQSTPIMTAVALKIA